MTHLYAKNVLADICTSLQRPVTDESDVTHLYAKNVLADICISLQWPLIGMALLSFFWGVYFICCLFC